MASGLTADEFEAVEAQYREILAEISQVPPSWITWTATPVTTTTSGGRRLLQAGTTTTFTYENIIYSENPSTVEANLKAAIDDGSFAKALSSIGLTLEENSESFPAAAPPAPSPPSDGGDDTNTAAIIAGSVVGGVVVLGAVAAGFIYMSKHKRPSTGGIYGGTRPKKGEGMWSSNPAADDGDDVEGGMKSSSSSKKQKSSKGATYGNDTFNMEGDDVLGGDKVDKDGNPLYDTNASNLSAPGGTSYAAAAAAAGAGAAAGATFSNNAFQEVDALDTPKAGGKDANPLYDSQNSQLSAPDTDRAYQSYGKAATEVSMMSARSRAESARDGLQSNKLFGIDDDFEDANEGNNPAFESARSGKNDLLGTAESLGETYGGESGFNTARSGGLTDRSSNNPVAAEGGANPLFGDEGGADGEEPLPSRGFFGASKGKK